MPQKSKIDTLLFSAGKQIKTRGSGNFQDRKDKSSELFFHGDFIMWFSKGQKLKHHIMSTPDLDEYDDFNWTSVCDEALRQEEESSSKNLPSSENVCQDRAIVQVQFKKPFVKVRTSRKPAVKRKFPGPAGVVGKIDVGSASGPKVAKIVRNEAEDEEESEPISSQPESSFLSAAELMDKNKAWQKMLKDETNVQELMGKFDTKFIFDKITTYGLQPMRSPFLVGVIKSIISNPGLDPDIELMDKNGKISGLIHRDVVDSDGDKLKPGTDVTNYFVKLLIIKILF